jgi:hypothetical protein
MNPSGLFIYSMSPIDEQNMSSNGGYQLVRFRRKVETHLKSYFVTILIVFLAYEKVRISNKMIVQMYNGFYSSSLRFNLVWCTR